MILILLVSQIPTIPPTRSAHTQPYTRDYKSRGQSSDGVDGSRGSFRGGFKGHRKSSAGFRKSKPIGGVARKKNPGKRNSTSTYATASGRGKGGSVGFSGEGIGIMPT